MPSDKDSRGWTCQRSRRWRKSVDLLGDHHCCGAPGHYHQTDCRVWAHTAAHATRDRWRVSTSHLGIQPWGGLRLKRRTTVALDLHGTVDLRASHPWTGLYRSTREGEYYRTLALALVCAGATGNLIDRLSSSWGVVDFIDVGLGLHRWPTFNVADMAVSTGAVLLAWVLLQEDRATARVMAVGDQ